jgi:hypothetical protein
MHEGLRELRLQMLALLWIIVICLIGGNIVAALVGIHDQIDGNDHCASKRRRIAYVFAGYGVGCWLGDVP